MARRDDAPLHRGGITTHDGKLDRPLGTGGWILPELLDVEGDSLRWEWPLPGRVTAPGDLLNRFRRLADASDDTIRAFAARWGLLLYRPDERAEHGPDCVSCLMVTGQWPKFPGNFPAHGSEPLALWRALAHDAGVVLRCAALLHQGDLPSEQEWADFRCLDVHLARKMRSSPPTARPPNVRYEPAPEGEFVFGDFGGGRQPTSFLAFFVSQLLSGAHLEVRLAPIGAPQRFAMQLEPRGLLGAIGLQLAQAIARTDGLALCDGCGVPYSPARKPRAGQRRFCEACHENRAPQRAAERAYRERRRSAR